MSRKTPLQSEEKLHQSSFRLLLSESARLMFDRSLLFHSCTLAPANSPCAHPPPPPPAAIPIGCIVRPFSYRQPSRAADWLWVPLLLALRGDILQTPKRAACRVRWRSEVEALEGRREQGREAPLRTHAKCLCGRQVDGGVRLWMGHLFPPQHELEALAHPQNGRHPVTQHTSDLPCPVWICDEFPAVLS